jgi:glycine/D-amino acid oxidase-like deaminating enzyme
MFDYLILGQGLAGSLLAWQLIRRGRRVLVIDDGHRSSSSRVAAGLINPLAGMRFNAAAETAAWLEAMDRTYRQIAGELDSEPYLHRIDMQRLLRSPEQRRFYERQRDNPALAGYLGRPLAPGGADPGIRSPHGGFEQRATGYLDLPRLLDDLRGWLQDRGAYIRLELAYERIVLSADAVNVEGKQAAHLLCCEGYRMQDNPWFGALPLQPDKGELLRLRAARPLCRHIINGAYWVVPLADGDFRFGATHEHHQIDCEPTEDGRATLLEGLRQMLEDVPEIEITEHAAGVRPATSDRRPLLGTHASHPRVHLFNGFGARGALSIPWYSERMCAHLLDGAVLPDNADIRRFDA